MNDKNEIDSPIDQPSNKKPRVSLLQNYISFVGFAIAAASLTSFVLLVLVEFTGGTDNPYADLITFIFVPSFLVFGLFIVLVGVLYERRRRSRLTNDEVAAYPILDLNDPRRRRSVVTFLSLAFIFLFLTAFGSYRAFEYTESVAFCGLACHNVMKPEYVAYNASPHAKVKCVECHVGGGAKAYVRYKFAGMRQLYGVVSGHYDRPIKTPVHNMRSATETCQKCHWSEKYHGDVIKVFNHYNYDQENSLDQTRMLLKVGGGNPNAGQTGGIHWHMNIANQITFVSTDEQRQVIPWVQIKDAAGRIVEYKTKDSQVSSRDIEGLAKRTMDCIDCHSRPAHIYLSPNDAVDKSLSSGRLDTSLPFIKAKAVEVLNKPYQTNDEAIKTIATDLTNYYRSDHPDIYSAKLQTIGSAIAEVQQIYQTNFFPEMKTDWKASPNNIGHYNATGCFRCHDGQHFSSEGKVIRNDCAICHTTMDQTIAGKSMTSTDGSFRHPVDLGDRNTFQCAACHKGDRTFTHPLNLGDISQFKCSECHKSESIGKY